MSKQANFFSLLSDEDSEQTPELIDVFPEKTNRIHPKCDPETAATRKEMRRYPLASLDRMSLEESKKAKVAVVDYEEDKEAAEDYERDCGRDLVDAKEFQREKGKETMAAAQRRAKELRDGVRRQRHAMSHFPL